MTYRNGPSIQKPHRAMWLFSFVLINSILLIYFNKSFLISIEPRVTVCNPWKSIHQVKVVQIRANPRHAHCSLIPNSRTEVQDKVCGGEQQRVSWEQMTESLQHYWKLLNLKTVFLYSLCSLEFINPRLLDRSHSPEHQEGFSLQACVSKTDTHNQQSHFLPASATYICMFMPDCLEDQHAYGSSLLNWALTMPPGKCDIKGLQTSFPFSISIKCTCM